MLCSRLWTFKVSVCETPFFGPEIVSLSYTLNVELDSLTGRQWPLVHIPGKRLLHLTVGKASLMQWNTLGRVPALSVDQRWRPANQNRLPRPRTGSAASSLRPLPARPEAGGSSPWVPDPARSGPCTAAPAGFSSHAYPRPRRYRCPHCITSISPRSSCPVMTSGTS